MSEWDEMVLIGRITRPHGLKGHAVVAPETDFVDERFAAGSTMWAGGLATAPREVTVSGARVVGGRLVVAFGGVEHIDALDGLIGTELRIPESALRVLDAGQYYEHQLAGCVVETTAGEVVGTVSRIEGGFGASRLIVNGSRGEVQVPFVMPICRQINVVARKILIEPPDGLLDLNR